ncbi:MAG: hypothetical protein N2595_00360 [bacterium]|nr:hypothetical protein [bacterium]
MRKFLLLVLMVNVLNCYAMIATGRVAFVHGGDTLRVMVPRVAANYGDAVLASTRETSLAGRRAVVHTFVNEQSTRHIVMIVYPEDGITNVYTFITVKLPGGPTAGPNDPQGQVAQEYLARKLQGHEVLLEAATSAADGTLEGSVRVIKDKKRAGLVAQYQRTKIYHRAKEAGPPSPPTGYSYQLTSDSLIVKGKSRVKLFEAMGTATSQ